jgi:hypothetical protein
VEGGSGSAAGVGLEAATAALAAVRAGVAEVRLAREAAEMESEAGEEARLGAAAGFVAEEAVPLATEAVPSEVAATEGADWATDLPGGGSEVARVADMVAPRVVVTAGVAGEAAATEEGGSGLGIQCRAICSLRPLASRRAPC